MSICLLLLREDASNTLQWATAVAAMC